MTVICCWYLLWKLIIRRIKPPYMNIQTVCFYLKEKYNRHMWLTTCVHICVSSRLLSLPKTRAMHNWAHIMLMVCFMILWCAVFPFLPSTKSLGQIRYSQAKFIAAYLNLQLFAYTIISTVIKQHWLNIGYNVSGEPGQTV